MGRDGKGHRTLGRVEEIGVGPRTYSRHRGRGEERGTGTTDKERRGPRRGVRRGKDAETPRSPE